MIIGLSHPAIVVPDLERGRVFYEHMFGFEVIRQESWDAPDPSYDRGVGLVHSSADGYILGGRNCYLELWKYSAPNPRGVPAAMGANDYGIRHLAFEVDDVHKEIARFCLLGGSLMNRPEKNQPGYNAVYARDPFGNIIELMEAGPCFPPLSDLTLALSSAPQ